MPHKSQLINHNMFESLEKLTAAVEAACADIAPSYAEYVQLAMAIATDCGEGGRADFHRICSFSPKYQSSHADRLYTNALKNGHGNVHLGTAFHLAQTAGVEIREEKRAKDTKNALNAENAVPPFSHTHAHVSYNADGNGQPDTTDTADCREEKLSGSEPLLPLPLLPEAEWPEPLQHIRSYGATGAQRDVLLLGALTVLGACMERNARCLYGGKMQSPCLQTFVVAPSAAGKGILGFVRLLIEPIHDEIRRQVEQQMSAYKKAKSSYNAMGKERSKVEEPEMPPNRMFIISGNNTGTGILQNIMDSNGTGIIFETEADTISTAIGTDYGHWSHTLRRAFDHDFLSYNRRTDQEYREVKKSYLSILISGTPAQVKPLIPSAENGLFSRQIFYYMPAIHEWQDQFGTHNTDMEKLFTAMGEEWKRQLDALKQGGLYTLKFTEEQQNEFNKLFSALFLHAHTNQNDEMSSSVARMAVNICRIATIVGLLRGDLTPDAELSADNLKDGIVTRWDIHLSPADFKAVIGLVEPLYIHAAHILSFLPPTEINPPYQRRPRQFLQRHAAHLQSCGTVGTCYGDGHQRQHRTKLAASPAETWCSARNGKQRPLSQNLMLCSADRLLLYNAYVRV